MVHHAKLGYKLKAESGSRDTFRTKPGQTDMVISITPPVPNFVTGGITTVTALETQEPTGEVLKGAWKGQQRRWTLTAATPAGH